MQKFILALLPALAAAQTIRIDVGLNGLAFTPNNVTAGVGTTLEFVYHPKKHSVSQSSFTAPCVPLEGGFNSGFVPVTSGEGSEIFTVVVNNTEPIWIYCAQTEGNHCQNGMSMVVNQPTDPAKSLAVYQANAKSVSISQILPNVEGGLFIQNTDTNSTSNSTVSMTYPSMTSMADSTGTGGVIYSGVSTTYTVAPGSAYTVSGTTYTAATTGVASPSNTVGAQQGAAVAGKVLDWALFGGVVALGAIVV